MNKEVDDAIVIKNLIIFNGFFRLHLITPKTLVVSIKLIYFHTWQAFATDNTDVN